MISLEDIKYCAEECARQHSGEMSVYHMCDTLFMARDWEPTKESWPNDIKALGRLIEPEKNANGYRLTPVIVGGKVLAPVRLEERVTSLCAALVDGFIGPDEFYEEFEEIHPFIDGNGRVGSILWNWAGGTLGAPVVPPDIFKVTTFEDDGDDGTARNSRGKY